MRCCAYCSVLSWKQVVVLQDPISGQENAGVWLSIFVVVYSGCTTNALRLQGGANNRTGRLEFCSNGEWGTVCDDLFGTPDAMVACRQLGFSPTGE